LSKNVSEKLFRLVVDNADFAKENKTNRVLHDLETIKKRANAIYGFID